MDVSAETADLVVKESLQATESAAKLLGSGVKNVAALLLAIAKDNYKVVGKTNSKRLARDPAPAEVIRIKKEDMGQFQKLAKEFGVLFFFAQKKGNKSGYVNVVSTQNYAAQLNAVMEAMGYPIPQDELELLRRRGAGPVLDRVEQVTDGAGLERLRRAAEGVHISEEVLEYIVRLVGATRTHPAVAQGGSPRATLAVAAVSRAAAFLQGRDYVLPEDVSQFFRDTVAHRLILTDAGETGDPVGDVLKSVRPPRLG